MHQSIASYERALEEPINTRNEQDPGRFEWKKFEQQPLKCNYIRHDLFQFFVAACSWDGKVDRLRNWSSIINQGSWKLNWKIESGNSKFLWVKGGDSVLQQFRRLKVGNEWSQAHVFIAWGDASHGKLVCMWNEGLHAWACTGAWETQMQLV